MKRNFYASWHEESRGACMDYLHGQVTDAEVKAACYYEYARESEVLKRAAEFRDQIKKEPCLDGDILDEVFERTLNDSVLSEKHEYLEWINQDHCQCILECFSFPGIPWNQLTQDKRNMMLLETLQTSEMKPLKMHSLSRLKSLGVFKKLISKAKKASGLRAEIPDAKPLIVYGQWLHGVFTIDFSKTKKRLMEEFNAWLDLPDNQERLRTFECPPIEKSGTFKDRLKDLAVWRLYDDLGFAEMLNFTRDNRRRYDRPAKVGGEQYRKGDPMPFHDVRHGQSPRVEKLNQAPLFSEESSALKAKKRAEEFLKEFIPWEFDSDNA